MLFNRLLLLSLIACLIKPIKNFVTKIFEFKASNSLLSMLNIILADSIRKIFWFVFKSFTFLLFKYLIIPDIVGVLWIFWAISSEPILSIFANLDIRCLFNWVLSSIK